MFNVTTKSLTWGDKELILETGKIARQADGAVWLLMEILNYYVQ